MSKQVQLTLALDPKPLHARLLQIETLLERSNHREARMLLRDLTNDLPSIVSQMLTVTPTGP